MDIKSSHCTIKTIAQEIFADLNLKVVLKFKKNEEVIWHFLLNKGETFLPNQIMYGFNS